MKWLILLALVACGKHQSPAALDTRDNDGDQIQNYQEKDILAQNIASIEPISEITGALRIEQYPEMNIKFSNYFDIKAQINKLIIAPEGTVVKEEHFSEWSQLLLNDIPKYKDLRLAKYVLNLNFESKTMNPDEVYLVTGKAKVKLGNWRPHMRVELSHEYLHAIFSGEAKLKLKKNYLSDLYPQSKDETIQNSTYRLFFLNEEGKGQILYVSKKLPFAELLTELGINEFLAATDDELFFRGHDVQKRWLFKNLAKQDKVLIYNSLNNLQASFLARFEITKQKISRVNGKLKSSLKVEKDSGKVAYLRFKAIKTHRTFVESTEKSQYGGGGGGGREGNGAEWKTCYHQNRTIQTEVNVDPDLSEVLGNLSIINMTPQLNNEIIETIETKSKRMNSFWEVKIDRRIEKLNLGMESLSTDFVQVGRYVNCNKVVPPNTNNMANVEGQFTLEVETFVEKL